ncbi:MAG TPA: aminotransferase class V-fold PLP-dependent enzyme, partial [Candidatus Limnocylindrales bacterium]|nr:aminotransferase class V-fold PLP-dependent enzyme [Candidatus Limnocylindrales bacterium]
MPKKVIYLDYAAATPVNKRVTEVMRPFYAETFQNPSANYMAARDMRLQLDAARDRVAAVLGAKPTEVIFTAGGTEANNLAILGVAQSFPGSHIVTTALEHDSVLAPVNHLQSLGWSITEVRPGLDGVVDP